MQMEMKSRTAKALELRRKAGMLERLGSALHGARVLAHSPACGLLWAEAWQEHAAGTLSGRCGVSISQHMSQLPVLQQQGQQREPGGRAAPVGLWEAGGSREQSHPACIPNCQEALLGSRL